MLYVTAGPIKEDDLTKWSGTLVGPSDTPYEGGIFQLEITFPEEYPYKPPKIIFKTPIYHPWSITIHNFIFFYRSK